MKKVLLLLIVLIGFNLNTQSQINQSNLKWGDYPVEKKEEISKVICQDQNGIWLIRKIKKSTFVDVYSKKLKKTKTIDLHLDRDAKIVHSYDDNEYIYLIQTKPSATKVSTLEFFLLRLNKKSRNIKVYPNSFFDTPVAALASRVLKENIFLRASRNGKFIGIGHNLSVGWKKQLKKNKISFKVISSDGKLHYSTATDTSTANLTSIRDLHVSNDGDLSVLFKTNNIDRVFVGKAEIEYKFHLSHFSNKGTEHISKDLAIDSYLMNELKMESTGSGNYLICGVYSKKYYSIIEGVVCFDFNPNTKELIASNHNYSDTFKSIINPKRSKKKEKKDKPTSYPYENIITDIIIHKDGSKSIILEKLSEYVIQSEKASRSMESYGNIYVTRINSDGSFKWAKHIAKQLSGGAGASHLSHTSGYKDGDLFFFYNGNKKNLNAFTKAELKTAHPDSQKAVILAKMDENGNYKKSIVYSYKEFDKRLNTALCKQFTFDGIILINNKTKMIKTINFQTAFYKF